MRQISDAARPFRCAGASPGSATACAVARKPCRSAREGATRKVVRIGRGWPVVGHALAVPSAGETVPPVVGVDFPGGRPCFWLLPVAVFGEIARPTPLVFGEQWRTRQPRRGKTSGVGREHDNGGNLFFKLREELGPVNWDTYHRIDDWMYPCFGWKNEMVWFGFDVFCSPEQQQGGVGGLAPLVVVLCLIMFMFRREKYGLNQRFICFCTDMGWVTSRHGMG